MNLITLAPDIPTRALKELATLADASGIQAVAGGAFCLADANPGARAPVAAYCAANRIDFGWVPARRRLDDFGLVVMDMDSTLITIECIDEIADMQGLKPEVSAITEAAMRGELDFSASLLRRVALLKGLPEAALRRAYDERLQLSPGAEELIASLKAAGIRTLLVSGGFTFFTERLRERLGLDYTAANTLEVIDGRLTGKLVGAIVDAQAKAEHLLRVRDQLGLRPGQTLAMGDGANDLGMMAASGVSVAYRAKPLVREQADYALNFSGLAGILALMGGK